MTVSKSVGLLLGLATATICLTIGRAVPTRACISDQPRPVGARTDEEYQRELERVGWTSRAARAVVANQADYWRLLDENGREEVDDILDRLYARLGGHDRWLRKLELRPEYAGLLAGLLNAADDGPDIFLDSLDSLRHHEAVIDSLYEFDANPEEALRMARLLKEEGERVPRLVERDASSLIELFQRERLPRDLDARRIYRDWARRLVDGGLSSPDDRLSQIQSALKIHASAVAERLDKDLDFRGRFDEIAPLANEILLEEDELKWGLFVGAPAIWEYFQMYGVNGKEYTETFGAVAIDLLTTPEYRDDSIRWKILDAVRLGDGMTIQVLLNDDLRKRQSFVNLLKRGLPPETLATALAKLQAEPHKTPNLLAYYASLSDAALIKDLGPQHAGVEAWLPGYSIYVLIDKARTGREVGGFDVAFAGLDVFETIAVMKGANIGLKAIQKAVKTGLKRQGAHVVADRAAQATARELFPWAIKEAATGARNVLKHAIKTASRTLTVDVTDIVRIAYRDSGVGRETFKKLTKLEARVFMREDRRVLIDLTSAAAKDHVLGRYLRTTALNGGVSEVGGALVATKTGGKVVRASAAQMETWRKHVGAWWLANATRSLDRMVAPVAADPF